MTEERFYYEERIDSIIDEQEDKGYSPKSLKALTVLLNDFVNENKELNKLYDISEQLIKSLSELNEELEQIQQELVDENRKLKKELSETIDLLSREIASSENCFEGLQKENKRLKQELFEARKECLWATSDEVDRALYYEDEVEELRKEIFE